MLAYIASIVGDNRWRARKEYLEAAQAGAIHVRARADLMAHTRNLIPREEWGRAEWLEPPDPLSVGFHFFGQGLPTWYDREVRWVDVEALWSKPTEEPPAKPVKEPPATPARRHGPLAGEHNPVERERIDLIPTLQEARHGRETLRGTIVRLAHTKKIVLPGSGDWNSNVTSLARVWGRVEREKKLAAKKLAAKKLAETKEL